MDLWNLELILLQLLDQLVSIQFAVASSSLDNLGLLVQSKVLPREIRTNVFFEQGKDFVVGDCSRVGEVVDSGVFVLGEENGGWEEIVEDGVGVGDIDYAVVFGNLGNEVAAVEVIADGHSETEDVSVGVCFHDLLNMCLGLRVERTSKVGLVSLEISFSANWMVIIVGIDTPGGKDSDMDSLLVTTICQIEGTNNVVSNGILPVILAPIDVWSSS